MFLITLKSKVYNAHAAKDMALSNDKEEHPLLC